MGTDHRASRLRARLTFALFMEDKQRESKGVTGSWGLGTEICLVGTQNRRGEKGFRSYLGAPRSAGALGMRKKHDSYKPDTVPAHIWVVVLEWNHILRACWSHTILRSRT